MYHQSGTSVLAKIIVTPGRHFCTGTIIVTDIARPDLARCDWQCGKKNTACGLDQALTHLSMALISFEHFCFADF